MNNTWTCHHRRRAMSALRALVLFCLFVEVTLVAQAQEGSIVDVGVYNDQGAWTDGVVAFERFLDWKGLTHTRIDAAFINGNDLRGQIRSVYFPGGYAYDYKTKLTALGERHIRDLVNSGGAYIGICAGAYFAADVVEWEGGRYPYTLGLFHGVAHGALAQIRPWPEWGMTGITLVPGHTITRGRGGSLQTLYFGGPVFHPDAGVAVDTIATWDAWNNEPAIIAFPLQQGRVLLVGPHPEIEENSDRDGTDFASDLTDPETEWGLLGAAVAWVLKRENDDSTATDAGSRPPAPLEQVLHVYPNPVRGTLRLEFQQEERSSVLIRLADPLGRIVATQDCGVRDRGTHHLVLQLDGASNQLQTGGVHHVTVIAGGRRVTRPVLVLP